MNIERKIEITFNWWTDAEEDTPPNRHLKLLEAHAEERIIEMRKDYITGGELHHEIDGIEYSGSWSFSYA